MPVIQVSFLPPGPKAEPARPRRWYPCCSNCWRLQTRSSHRGLAYACLADPTYRKGPARPLKESRLLDDACPEWVRPPDSAIDFYLHERQLRARRWIEISAWYRDYIAREATRAN